jgi:chromosome segregation ATPase
LKEILELENVNALVPNQRLTFGDQLTAIFGCNGSGKSGYARILGSAGFTRGDQEVLPDVTKLFDENQPVKATVKVDVDGTEKTIFHEVGKPCLELSSFYVFDSTSVQVHMTGKNTFSFSPAGLSVLTELSEATDEVRNRLNARIEKLEEPADFAKFFSGESIIRELIENLGAETDIENLKLLAQINKQDERRIHELEIEIGNIGLGQHNKEVQQKKQDLNVLRELHTWLVEAQKRLSSEVIANSNKQIVQYQELSNRAKELSVEHFQHERFAQTGVFVN